MTNTLREWAPLTDLFNRLPAKVQNGIFTYDIKLTSIDVLPEFLALGTNFGLVYWYDRKKKDLQKLRCENTNAPITVVKIISTVDYMVACGNKDGNISIFQVPKSHPDSVPESLRPKNKQVERYTVSELHSGPISALEWSKNGMKLFSGDKSGQVVLTEIDFYMHLCKSIEILNESYEVVQLSYHQQSLLVSTTYRSIICKKEDKWKVSQIGKKDRKVLGNFGGTFYQNSVRPNDIVLYCTRPGLRIWISDAHGCVQQTLLFKDILNQRSPEAPIINPISKNLRRLLPQKEASFGILVPFNNLLVTYSNDVVYVLNPKDLTVNTMVSHLRKVLSVAAHKDEVFILEGERSLIRLAERPEPIYEPTPSIPTASSFLPLTTSIKDLTHKLQSTSIISAIPPIIETAFGDFNVHMDATSIISAEEATESPSKTSPTSPNAQQNETHKKLKMYDKIAIQDFDDAILFKHQRRKKPNVTTTSIASWSSNSSEEQEPSVSKPTLMTISTVGILPDLRSPDSIKNDIENKEKMLADLLCFNKIVLSDRKVEIKENPNDEVVKNDRGLNSESENSTDLNDGNDFVVKPFGEISPRFNGIKQNGLLEPCAYGPPSGSSNPNSMTDVPVCMNIPSDWQLQNVRVKNERKTTESSVSDLSGEWEII